MENLSDRDLRSEIALVSYYSGMNLANAGLGVVHGLAGPVGGFSHMPHGSVCGTLLHDAFRMTVEKLKGTESPVLNKLAGLGSFLAGRELPVDEGCGVLLTRLESWKRKYDIPRLSDYGFSRQDLEKIAAAGGNKDHPVEFSREDMFKLLECRL